MHGSFAEMYGSFDMEMHLHRLRGAVDKSGGVQKFIPEHKVVIGNSVQKVSVSHFT